MGIGSLKAAIPANEIAAATTSWTIAIRRGSVPRVSRPMSRISPAVMTAQRTVSSSPWPMVKVMPPGLDRHTSPTKAMSTPIQVAAPSRRRKTISSRRGTNGT
ncbi:hypothetical protein D3C72_961060 [compost metagenome]